MKTAHFLALLSLATVTTLACGGRRRVTIEIPPRLDVRHYSRVGIVTFTVENAKGELHQVATSRFAEAVLSAQPGVEVLELGSADSVTRRVGEIRFGAAAAKAAGDAHDVPAVFSGHLKVSNVKPRGGIAGIALPFVEADVTVELSVALHSTESGGTVWRSSAVASEKVGQLSLAGGEPSFSAKNPNDAYGRLVNGLVNYVTRDLRPTWRRQ